MWFLPLRNTCKHLFAPKRTLKTKEVIPEASLGILWVLRGSLQEHGWPRQLRPWKVHANIADDSWNLHPRSSLHDLQTTPLFQELFLAYYKQGWGLGALLASYAFWILCVSRDSWALEVSLAPRVLRVNISIQRESLLHTFERKTQACWAVDPHPSFLPALDVFLHT